MLAKNTTLQRLFKMENSKKLLDYAIAHMEEGSVPEKNWQVGGGTVLAEIYNHRISKDIDIFVDDRQFLERLSPRINDANENRLMDYDEASNYIKLSFDEGKVDFIDGGQITAFNPQKRKFLGKEVLVSDPVEIVSKKIYFRANKALPRDLFDLATVYESDRKNDSIQEAVKKPDKLTILENSITQRIQQGKLVPFSISYPSLILEDG